MDDLQRDKFGRVTAPDGLPLGGNARVNEVAAVSGLRRSKLYSMCEAGELASVRVGRTVLIPWREVRSVLLEPGVQS